MNIASFFVYFNEVQIIEILEERIIILFVTI